jgi:hypothetical protein
MKPNYTLDGTLRKTVDEFPASPAGSRKRITRGLIP